MTQRMPSEETLQEIIRRVVEIAEPQRVILFGYAARGDMGSSSDVDLLKTKSGMGLMLMQVRCMWI